MSQRLKTTAYLIENVPWDVTGPEELRRLFHGDFSRFVVAATEEQVGKVPLLGFCQLEIVHVGFGLVKVYGLCVFVVVLLVSAFFCVVRLF